MLGERPRHCRVLARARRAVEPGQDASAASSWARRAVAIALSPCATAANAGAVEPHPAIPRAGHKRDSPTPRSYAGSDPSRGGADRATSALRAGALEIPVIGAVPGETTTPALRAGALEIPVIGRYQAKRQHRSPCTGENCQRIIVELLGVVALPGWRAPAAARNLPPWGQTSVSATAGPSPRQRAPGQDRSRG
jgi:hypothetical protein